MKEEEKEQQERIKRMYENPTPINGDNSIIFGGSIKLKTSILELVTEMRKHQKAYFRTRSSDELRLSKEFEKKVDDFIESQRWVQTLF